MKINVFRLTQKKRHFADGIEIVFFLKTKLYWNFFLMLCFKSQPFVIGLDDSLAN